MRIRPERVAEQIKREAADILENDLNDPRVSGLLSVTDVEVTPDLSFAKIYVSVMAPGPEGERVLAALEHAAPFVRRRLAPRPKLREMPEIRFVRDDSHGARRAGRGAAAQARRGRAHRRRGREDVSGSEPHGYAGLLAVDKPTGVTSHDVVLKVRRRLRSPWRRAPRHARSRRERAADGGDGRRDPGHPGVAGR